MRRMYKKSPIIEAVCEFQFEEESPWDLAVPGLVYEQIRKDFPIRRQAQRVSLSLPFNLEQIEPRLGTISLMQFLREDEKAMVQVGSQLLSISVLKPYPSWPRFLAIIKKGFNAYREVVAPKGIRRIGLRYINQIDIPGQNVKLENYFEFRPYVGPNLSQDIGTFLCGVHMPFEASRDILNLQLASLPNPNSTEVGATLALSLDYFLLNPGEVALEDTFTWVNVAHEHIEGTFEACITQELRNLFQEVKK